MTHFLTTQVGQHGYLAIFLLMVLESACIPIPSEVIMLFGGALAGGLLASRGHAQITLVGVAVAGAVGNLAGSLVAYGVGRARGSRLPGRPWRRAWPRSPSSARIRHGGGGRGPAGPPGQDASEMSVVRRG